MEPVNTVLNPDHPVDASGVPIQWDDNDATLDGILYELDLFFERTGHHLALFEHRAVALSNGKLAISDNTSAVAANAAWGAPSFVVGRVW